MVTIIGSSGAAIILVFFLLSQFHKISIDNIWYDVANCVGSLLLVLYAYLLSSWPFSILNTIWALASLKDIISDLKTKKEINKI